MKSDKIDLIIPALLKAQGELEHAKKDSSNPHFKSKYADLATVLDTCKPVLQANDLLVTHQRESTEAGEFLITTLWHKSGQFLNSRSKLMPTKADPQGFGSALTYARRYDLSALIGLASDDDDGNAASAEPKIKAVFANAALLKKFTQNVIDSFNQIDEHDDNALETLKTLSELNAEKIAELKNSGNEHDALAVDEIRKQYTLKKNLIDQTRMMNEQMRAK
jgi:hypothetical protein